MNEPHSLVADRHLRGHPGIDLERELPALGVHGYTITDARGSGTHGRGSGAWRKEGNIRVDILSSRFWPSGWRKTPRRAYEANYGPSDLSTPVRVHQRLSRPAFQSSQSGRCLVFTPPLVGGVFLYLLQGARLPVQHRRAAVTSCRPGRGDSRADELGGDSAMKRAFTTARARSTPSSS